MTPDRMSLPARWLRALSGLLVGGLVVLAVALGVGWLIASWGGGTGPGPATLIWHGLAAVAAVPLQVYADRHQDGRGTAAAAVAAGITVAVLAVQWLL